MTMKKDTKPEKAEKKEEKRRKKLLIITKCFSAKLLLQKRLSSFFPL